MAKLKPLELARQHPRTRRTFREEAEFMVREIRRRVLSDAAAARTASRCERRSKDSPGAIRWLIPRPWPPRRNL